MKTHLHDVTIKQIGRKTEVTIDGLKVEGLTDVTYSASADYPSKVAIEFYVGNLNIDQEENNETR